jgi:hypothetical protein
MKLLPFRALFSIEPFGVLCFDPTNGFQLWSARAWLRHRGGMRAHYDDINSNRTIVVDHLEFAPRARPGLGCDELGRCTPHVTLAMACGIAFSRDEGLDDRYLQRCFSRYEADQIMNALFALAGELSGAPLPFSEATADLSDAVVHRTDDVLVIR